MELLVLVGIVAVVVTVLKGHPWPAIGVLAVGVGLIVAIAVRGDATHGDVSTLTQTLMVVGFPVWSLLAVGVAVRPSTPTSPWARRNATDASGRPLMAAEPVPRRLGRALFGALVGLLPAAVFMAVAIATADTGDEAQLGFVGIPFGFLGAVLGAVIGFNWPPRLGNDPTADRAPERPSPRPRPDRRDDRSPDAMV
jgi:hypothetical protein